MMTTNGANNSHPGIANFKSDMYNLCTGLANIANEIGKSNPSWPAEVVREINQQLDAPIDNIARLPDELATGIIQIAGAHIHSIGRLMGDAFTSPAIVAPLARSALEYSALLVFLNRDEDPTVRTVRNVRALRAGMNIDKVHRRPILEDLYAGLSEIVKKYTNQNTIHELKHDSFGFRKIVEHTLSDQVAIEFYDELCSYMHHNTWKAYLQFGTTNIDPTSLELDSLYFAQQAALALARATLSIYKYRSEKDTHDLRIALDIEVERLLILGNEINLFERSLLEE